MASDSVVSGIVSASALEMFIGAIKPVVDECKIHFGDDGLTVRAVDASTVDMIGPARMRPEAFESYNAPGSVVIGIGLGRFEDYIEPASKAGELVEFSVNMERRVLEIHYAGTDLTLRMIDTSSIRPEPDIPDIDLTSKVELTGQKLAHMVGMCDMVSNYVTFEGDGTSFTASAEGDVDDATVSVGPEDDAEIHADPTDMAMFSINKYENLVDPIPSNATVELRYGDEMPMKLNWEHPDEYIEITGIIAPRIQSD